MTLGVGAEIYFRGVAFPDVNLTRLYFGFDARFDDATFSGYARFD